jgi:hypothetical protein
MLESILAKKLQKIKLVLKFLTVCKQNYILNFPLYTCASSPISGGVVSTVVIASASGPDDRGFEYQLGVTV